MAAERSPGGQAYFLADDDLVQFRHWVTQLLQIEGVNPSNSSVPYAFAWSMAGFLEQLWTLQQRDGTPPMTQTMVKLIGRGFTFSDRKAREELGYAPIVTRQQGLAALKAAKLNPIAH